MTEDQNNQSMIDQTCTDEDQQQERYGYIYLTISPNGKRYVGQHKYPGKGIDPHYIGSGARLARDVKKYGKDSFVTFKLFNAHSREGADKLERYAIRFLSVINKDKMYNVLPGGEGGIRPEIENDPVRKQAFIDKMTAINRARCQTDEFREQASERMKARMHDPETLEKHAAKVRATWSRDDMRQAQSERLKEYYKEHGVHKDLSNVYKPCVFELDGKRIEFESVKDLREFLINEYDYNPDRRTFKKLMQNGADGIPYTARFYKNVNLNGCLMYYKQDESVTTMGDECNPVE